MNILSRKGLSLERLRAFVAIHEAGGLSRAAPDDPVRQSQLSRQLSELEAALEVTLFERRNRSLFPTPAAQRLAGLVRELAGGLDGLRAQSVEPPLVVGAGGSVCQWLILPGHVANEGALRLVTCSSEEVVDGLVDGSLDVGVLRQRQTAPMLETVSLGRVPYRWFCAKTRVERQPPDVSSVPLVVVTGEPALSPFFSLLGRPALECETFVQAAGAISTGRFGGVLPAFADIALPPSRFWAIDLPALRGAASTLTMAWAKRAEDRRPARTRARRALLRRLKDVLA